MIGTHHRFVKNLQAPLPHIPLRLRFRVHIAPMMHLGIGLRIMLHERPMSCPFLSAHFRYTRGLRLIIRSRRISRRSRLLTIRLCMTRQRRFLRRSIFIIRTTISIRNGSIAGNIAIACVVVVVVVLIFGGEGSGADGSELGVLHAFVFVLGLASALPEAAFAVAGGVVVGGAGTIAFFAFVGAGEEDFESGADEEEEAGGWVRNCLLSGLRGDMLTQR